MSERFEGVPKVEYDAIAGEYARLNAVRPLMEFAVYPSFFKAVGDVHGKSLLDLACGEGIISREMKRRGAEHVVGIDLSQEMLGFAKKQERSDQLGIEYRQGRVGMLGILGEFDVVTGGFLLHYARSLAELNSMCADVSENLKPGGMFVSVNNNSLHPLAGPKYQNEITANGPLLDGSELTVHSEVDGVKFPFKNYFWKRRTYENALQANGMTDIKWLDIKPTEEGIQKNGAEFWDDFLKNPFHVIVSARKISA